MRFTYEELSEIYNVSFDINPDWIFRDICINDDDEIIIAIRFPIPDVAHYVKFPNPASRYALVGVFVARFGHTVRVAVTGAAPCVFRFSAAEQALENRFEADSLKGVSFPPADLNEDMHASAEYRAHLIGVLTRRALTGE